MNVTMTIEVSPEKAIEIARLLGNSSNAVSTVTAPHTPMVPPVAPPVQQTPVVAPVQPVPTQAAAPIATPPVPQASPVAPPPVPQAPPVTARKYTMDELAVASRPVCEAGRQTELLNLLHSFTYTDNVGNVQQVQSIQQLPEESYPAFANGIRNLGGKI